METGLWVGWCLQRIIEPEANSVHSIREIMKAYDEHDDCCKHEFQEADGKNALMHASVLYR